MANGSVRGDFEVQDVGWNSPGTVLWFVSMDHGVEDELDGLVRVDHCGPNCESGTTAKDMTVLRMESRHKVPNTHGFGTISE